MFETLSQRLARVVKTMRGEARLTEANTQEMLREIRIALLEADVALPVVRDFIAKVREKALGQEVISSLSPGQALVGVVHRELIDLIGGTTAELNLATQPPAVILMAGLQGAGKTTTVGKLAKWLREQKKKKVLTVSCDVYRPAAIEQLKTVSAQAGADFFEQEFESFLVGLRRGCCDTAGTIQRQLQGVEKALEPVQWHQHHVVQAQARQGLQLLARPLHPVRHKTFFRRQHRVGLCPGADAPEQAFGLEARTAADATGRVAAVLGQQHPDVHLVGLGL
jgi:energy-coupling factor transporter ATP-binding protein EcfA2